MKKNKKTFGGCDNHKTRLSMYNYHHQVISQKYKNQNSSCHFLLKSHFLYKNQSCEREWERGRKRTKYFKIIKNSLFNIIFEHHDNNIFAYVLLKKFLLTFSSSSSCILLINCKFLISILCKKWLCVSLSLLSTHFKSAIWINFNI